MEIMGKDLDLERSLSLIRDIPDYPKSGILFKDITPLLADPESFNTVLNALSVHTADIQYIAGIEARGFIIASALAHKTGKGFVPIRKKGKLPSKVYSRRYGLEYGEDELEIHQDAFPAGSRVLLIDDVLATGGTIRASLELIEEVGGLVPTVLVLLEIQGLNGRANIETGNSSVAVHSLMLS
jgi:adenine phosphoribosyltransferase